MGATISEISIEVNAVTTKADESLTAIDEQAAKTGESMQAAADEGVASMDAVGTAGEEAGAKVAAGSEEGSAGLKEQGAAAAESEGGMKGFLGSVLGIGAAVGGVMLASQAFDFLKEQVTELVTAGMDANKTEAQTVAVLHSTHDASGETAASVNDLAEKYMNLTGISKDTIQQTENMLLTFRGIGHEEFPQATQAALNMATALNIGPTQAALQLGKALNDPATGLSKLTREGVAFTKEQQDQIKAMVAAGNTAGAQKIMLGELNKEFGNSAEAAGQANGGIKILQAQMEETREKIGQALIPVLADLAHAFEPILTGAGKLIPAALDFLKTHADDAKIVLAVFAGVIAAAVVPALISLIAPLAVIVAGAIAAAAPFIAVGLALAGLALWLKHVYDTSVPFRDAIQQMMAVLSQVGETIGFYVQPALQKLGPIIEKVGSFIQGTLAQAAAYLIPQLIQAANAVTQFAVQIEQRLGPALTNIEDLFNTVMPVLQGIWDAVWPVMSAVLKDAWTVIQGVITVAFNLITGIFKVALDLIGGNWSGAWHDIQNTLSGVWNGIKLILSGALSAVWTLLQNTVGKILGLIGNLATGIGQELQALPGQVLALFVKLANGAIGELRTLEGDAISLGAQVLLGLLKGIESEIENVIKGVENAASSILSSLKGALGIHSPSAITHDMGTQLMQGLINGMTDSAGSVGSAATKAAGSALSAIKGATASSLYGTGGSALQSSATSAANLLQGVQQNITIKLDNTTVATASAKGLPQVLRAATGRNTM